MCGMRPHTSLFVARNKAVSLHADSNNRKEVPNLLIPLSYLEGEHLFVEDIRGHVESFSLPFLQFNARQRHLVLHGPVVSTRSGLLLVLSLLMLEGGLPAGPRPKVPLVSWQRALTRHGGKAGAGMATDRARQKTYAPCFRS